MTSQKSLIKKSSSNKFFFQIIFIQIIMCSIFEISSVQSVLAYDVSTSTYGVNSTQKGLSGGDVNSATYSGKASTVYEQPGTNNGTTSTYTFNVGWFSKYVLQTITQNSNTPSTVSGGESGGAIVYYLVNDSKNKNDSKCVNNILNLFINSSIKENKEEPSATELFTVDIFIKENSSDILTHKEVSKEISTQTSFELESEKDYVLVVTNDNYKPSKIFFSLCGEKNITLNMYAKDYSGEYNLDTQNQNENVNQKPEGKTYRTASLQYIKDTFWPKAVLISVGLIAIVGIIFLKNARKNTL